jgi:hypothetical protein
MLYLGPPRGLTNKKPRLDCVFFHSRSKNSLLLTEDSKSAPVAHPFARLRKGGSLCFLLM